MKQSLVLHSSTTLPNNGQSKNNGQANSHRKWREEKDAENQWQKWDMSSRMSRA